MITRSPIRGFTLIETIVTVAITAFVMVALGILIQYFYKTNEYALEQSQAVNSARSSIEHTVTDLREATYGADGSYPIAIAGTSTVTFYANINNDSNIEEVRYYLSDTSLLRGTTKSTGSPPTYVGQPETTTLVIDNMRNGTSTPIFTYFDENGAELPAPINTSKIRSVHIDALTDVNPYRAPAVYSLVGEATLRNL